MVIPVAVYVHSSNWRCVTIHGTNGVYVYGNVGFNIFGHCYYLEDGVEENNVLERNLAAFVHPLHMAGTTGGQAVSALHDLSHIRLIIAGSRSPVCLQLLFLCRPSAETASSVNSSCVRLHGSEAVFKCIIICCLLCMLKQGTDRWQNDTLADPTDAGGSGFYALNKRNSWQVTSCTFYCVDCMQWLLLVWRQLYPRCPAAGLHSQGFPDMCCSAQIIRV
jgi:hypothetical protein